MRPRSFTDADLLQVARSLFLEKGPGVSTSEIAKALGVSQAAIFKRFPTKRDLMVSALMPPVDEVTAMLKPSQIDDRPGYEQVLELARAVDGLLENMFPRMGVLRASGIDMEDILARHDPPPLLVYGWVSGFLRQLDEAGLATVPDPNVAAFGLLGAIHGRHELCRALGSRAPETNEDYIESVVGMLWSGIKPADSEQSNR